MSKESYCFCTENGQTAFLAGVVDVLTDRELSPICPVQTSVAADLYYIGENNEIDFNNAVRERLMKYIPSVGCSGKKLEETAESLGLRFRVQDNYGDFQAPGFLQKLFCSLPGYEHGREQHDAFCRFTEGVEHYLGRPVRFYSAEGSFKPLSPFYLYFIFGVIFMEYDGYLLMVMVGSNE